MRYMVRVLVGVALLAVASSVWAQSTRSFSQIVTVAVKPSGAADYEDYLKKLVAARDKVNLQAPARVTVYTHRVGPQFTYLLVAPFSSWGEIDSWQSPQDILTKAYGELEAGKLLRAARAAMESQSIDISRNLLDLSRNPASAPPPYRLATLTRVEVQQGMAPQYTLALTKIKAATEKAGGWPPQIVNTIIHGREVPTFNLVTPFTKWAERDTEFNLVEALEKMYGDVEARSILDTVSRVVKRRESVVIMQRPELSWMRKATTTD